ncbi:phytanoyl-CoA dioxygenase family protein [Paenibacillus hodogayensis]|uniref:Phytanoyl-CoA dioxygenase family protein n=1 Tax=Paenibacillus hodogayensis TaxID=279208 RepID=A0ABV5VV97_9BACL
MSTILSYEQLEQYGRDGYLVLRGVFTREEAALWRAECERLLSLSDIVDPLNIRVGFRQVGEESAVERFDPLVDISPVFAGLVKDERILTPLRDIYLDEPLLFKDKLVFKLPGMSGYTMHQDGAWWQGFPIQGLISVMVAIDGASGENGGLELFPGYHDRLRSAAGELRNMNEAEIAEIDLAKGELVETEPGDIILFHSLAPHRSGSNTANYSRKQLYLTYSPSRNGQLYQAHYQHFHRYGARGKKEETVQQSYFR